MMDVTECVPVDERRLARRKETYKDHLIRFVIENDWKMTCIHFHVLLRL